MTAYIIYISLTAVAFLVFDLDGDGFISADELLSQLQKTNTRGLTTSQLQAIVDSTFVLWDGDKDGKLNYEEFKGLVSASTASELCL
jgi:serine/threonine-protein phosphatase 2B regulatory subunit